jgi:DNA-binding response OmpR family regulator
LATVALQRVEGWAVMAAESGEEAVRIASTESPEAILLDVMMPGMDGPATLVELQSRPDTREIPVIFVTAQEGPADRAAFERLGAAGVIQKPFEISGLAEQVSGILRRAA